MTETTEKKPEIKTRKLTDFPPSEQWDRVARQLMIQELAPKGFKVSKNKNYHGAMAADIPFLSNKTVGKCQSIACQLVRSYRDKAKKELDEMISAREEGRDEIQAQYRACWFFQFKKKAGLKTTIFGYNSMIGMLEITKNKLDQMPVQ